MLVSTKGRYALRVMIDLAEHRSQGYVPLKDIAARQGISEMYLESILKILVGGRMVVGLRGKGGGYRLTREPEEYTVGQIIRLTEDSMSPVACLEPDSGECPHLAACRTVAMWRELDTLINNYLDGVSVADLAVNPQIGNDYVI